MQLLGRLCKKFGVQDTSSEEGIKELAAPTSVTVFVGEIEKSRESGLLEGKTVAEMEKAVDKKRPETDAVRYRPG